MTMHHACRVQVGFGDVKLPQNYTLPPVAPGAGLPSLDSNPFAATADERTAATPLPKQLVVCDCE